MNLSRPADTEWTIAQCRVMLSVAAFVTVFIDPTRPTLTRWFPLTGGPFTLDPFALTVMLSHVAYSAAVYIAVRRRILAPERIVVITTRADVGFGAVIALVTEGANSPFYVFFAFAVLAAGFRGGLRPTLQVTFASVALYFSLILVTRPEGFTFYVMRPAYLAITGYLVGYLGERRLVLESRIRELEGATLRQRIARSLHDGYAQALAGVNLRVETCRELLRRGLAEDALAELTDLQAGVNHEYDELRTYIRSLADLDATPVPATSEGGTQFSIRAEFRGSLPLVEHSLQIMLEGARNVGRHANAATAQITAASNGEKLCITLHDDGVGFPVGSAAPWSIASRASELDGEVRVGGGSRPGGHVEVELPLD